MKNITTWMFVGLLMLACLGLGYLSVVLAIPMQAEVSQPLAKIVDITQTQAAAANFMPRNNTWHMLTIIIILALNGMFYLQWLSRMGLATVYEYVEIHDSYCAIKDYGQLTRLPNRSKKTAILNRHGGRSITEPGNS